MGIVIRGQVGPQVLQDGTEQAVRLGKTAEFVVTELHGKYFEETYRGNIFAATAAVGALQANAATSMAPLGLYNPLGSGKLLVLVRTILALAALPGTQVAGAFAYYVQTAEQSAAPTSPTAVTPVPGRVGSGSAPVCKAYSVGTLAAAPTLYLPIAGKLGVTGGPSGAIRIIDEPDGAIILEPGTVLCVQESVADTTSNYTAMLGFVWEEVVI